MVLSSYMGEHLKPSAKSNIWLWINKALFSWQNYCKIWVPIFVQGKANQNILRVSVLLWQW